MVAAILMAVLHKAAAAVTAASPPACSLNGNLVAGKCKCDVQWEGPDCELLRLRLSTAE